MPLDATAVANMLGISSVEDLGRAVHDTHSTIPPWQLCPHAACAAVQGYKRSLNVAAQSTNMIDTNMRHTIVPVPTD